MSDPIEDRQLGGAFGSLSLRELLTAVALLGHCVSGKRDLYVGKQAATDADEAIDRMRELQR